MAVVDGHQIRGDEFRRTYQAQLQAYRAAYGGNMNEQLLKQLGVEQQILQQMVDERAALAEAERLRRPRQRRGSARSASIRSRRCRKTASSSARSAISSCWRRSGRRCPPPSSRRASAARWWSRSCAQTITEWLSVSDKELEEEYRRRNDKVKLAIVSFPADSYRLDVNVTDAELASHFEANKDDFKIPEKRKVKYLLIDVDALRAKVDGRRRPTSSAPTTTTSSSTRRPSRCAPATSC